MTKDPEIRRIIRALRRQRETHKLTQTQLAELIGVTRETVTRWETFAETPTTELLFQWTRTLHYRLGLIVDTLP